VNPKYPIAILSIALIAMLGFLAASCGAGRGAESAGPVPSEPRETGTAPESVLTATTEPESETGAETVPPPG